MNARFMLVVLVVLPMTSLGSFPELALAARLNQPPQPALANHHPVFRHNPRARLAHINKPSSFRLYVHDPKECQWISGTILKKHKFEAHIQKQILQILRKVSNGTEYFMDIGANLGTFSLNMAAAGFNVVAFEPLQYNTELLTASMGLNSFGRRIHLFKTAVAAHEMGKMCVKPASAGDPRHNQVWLE